MTDTMLSVEDYRQVFADEIRFVADLRSPAVVKAFATVPREKFLGPGPWRVGSPERRALAAAGIGKTSYVEIDDPRHLYHNVVVVLDAAGDINNGQPSALASWIDALDLEPGARVYHLGCGVGYYTAIMAEVVGPTGHLVGSEVNASLAARARDNLSVYSHVEVHAADGAELDPGECDAMFINAGVTHPQSMWLDRLREGGRLVLPITAATSPTLGAGLMVKIVRGPRTWSANGISSVGIYSCTSSRAAELEPIVLKALQTQSLLSVKSLRRETHDKEDTCLVHGADVCLSSAEPVP